MSIDWVSCGDSLSQVASIVDGDHQSVDFGMCRNNWEFPNSELSTNGSAPDSNIEFYATERTKHHTSQSAYSFPTSRKKQKLDSWEPEPNSSSSTFISEELEDLEVADLHSGRNLHAGLEIFSKWILLFVRYAFQFFDNLKAHA
jgi:hypothetical protein